MKLIVRTVSTVAGDVILARLGDLDPRLHMNDGIIWPVLVTMALRTEIFRRDIGYIDPTLVEAST